MMAENAESTPPILERQINDNEDNESVSSNDTENNPDLSRLETDIKEHMAQIASQVKNSISDMSSHIQQRFNDFDRHVQRLESQVLENTNRITSQDRVASLAQSNENSNNLQQLPLAASAVNNTNSVLNMSSQTDTQFQRISSNTETSRGDNSVKLKPQSFSGAPADEFEDYLAQFNITAEINGWNYKAKSLYLANSLTGNARSLLSELTEEQRKDYDCLVQKLTARYGSENRAEVFRAQLKSRVKGKNESIAELAQAIKKLSRQAYPNATLDVIEALALDHFIDALSESEIRLRLREVGPKTLSEAESVAVRMEAHRIADKQRTRLVGKIEQEKSAPLNGPSNMQSQMTTLNKSFDYLQRRVDNLYKQRNFSPSSNSRNFSNQNSQQLSNRNGFRRLVNAAGNNNNFPRQNNFRYNQQSRGDNPNNQCHSNQQPYANQNRQGNFRQPNQGSGFRLN